MAKISALPEKAVPTGAETVVILDGGISKRASIGPLVDAAVRPQVVESQAARAGAETAAASVAAVVGTATEVTVVEAAGVNLNVSYAAAADGTAGNAVGSPALIASGKSFTTSGGYAVSAADTAITAPAILRHVPNYALAVGRVNIAPVTGTTTANASRIGAIAQYQDDANFALWGFNKDTGAILFQRVTGGALSTQQTFPTTLGAGLYGRGRHAGCNRWRGRPQA